MEKNLEDAYDKSIMREIRTLRQMKIVNIVNVDKFAGKYTFYPSFEETPISKKVNLRPLYEETLSLALKAVKKESINNTSQLRGLIDRVRTVQPICPTQEESR